MSDPNRAECETCHEFKEVCCDSGYDELPDGTTEHTEPYCRECCPSSHAYYPSGTYERMDCDH